MAVRSFALPIERGSATRRERERDVKQQSCIHMSACVRVWACACARAYVCMYVCVYACMDVRMYGSVYMYIRVCM